MAGQIRIGDLLAGAIAAAVVPLLVFALGLPVWQAIVLAGATYAGIVLLRPRPERRAELGAGAGPEQIAYRTALANAAAIRALEPLIAKPAVRAQVGRIDDQIDRVLAVMREDGNLAAASLFDERLLVTFRALLTEYDLLTTRQVKGAAVVLAKIETRDLPLIEEKAGDFYEELHRAHVVDLAALSDILEFNLESIVVPKSRRPRP